MAIGHNAVEPPIEDGMDRPGFDYRVIALSDSRQEACQAECRRDLACRAYSWVRPGYYGAAQALCHLKGGAAPATPNPCCTSGLSRALEDGVDRPGGDYRHFLLPQPLPELCASACAGEPQCMSFTFVNSGFQSNGSAVCWLKSGIPAPVVNSCCISGRKDQWIAASSVGERQ
jgi:hypothetical protein